MILSRPLCSFCLLTCCLLPISCGDDRSDGGTCSLSPDGSNSCFGHLSSILPHACEKEVTASCATGAEASCASEVMAACATQYYLRDFEPNTLPNCDSAHPPLTIGDGSARLALSLYRYTQISDSAVVRHANGLQRYYEENGLTMTTADIARGDPVRYAIGGTPTEVNQALIDAGIDPSSDPDELTSAEEELVNQIISDVIFRPTREFLQRHALPVESKANVAVIDQIIAPEMVKALGIEEGMVVVGLGLSSSLLDRLEAEDPNAASLNTLLSIDSDFTPTLFVGHTDIARLTGNFDLVVAHEMGHALGLPHVTDSGNLMEQGGSLECRPWLGQDQIDIMGPLSEVVLTPDDALSRILAGRKNVLRYLRERQGEE